MTAISPDARFWDRAARKYAADPIKDQQGYERSLERMRHYLGATDRVLEFGCGTGTTALRMAPHVGSIMASDISAEMIQIAQQKARDQGQGNVTFAVGEPDGSNWSEGGFDAAFGMNVLHLIPERGTALRAVHRALKPGGLLITKTPCLKEMTPLIRLAVPVMQMIGKAPFVDFLSQDDLTHDITDTGFEMVETARHGSTGKDIRPFIVARRR